jgi:DNA-binding Xre family transcriptional regulator
VSPCDQGSVLYGQANALVQTEGSIVTTLRDVVSFENTFLWIAGTMSTTADLITLLKSELKTAGITYATVAARLGMAESSVKRMFSKSGDMPVSRIDDICRILNLDFADLARRVADTQPLLLELTLAQEKAVVADRKLLIVAICVLSQLPAEESRVGALPDPARSPRHH